MITLTLIRKLISASLILFELIKVPLPVPSMRLLYLIVRAPLIYTYSLVCKYTLTKGNKHTFKASVMSDILSMTLVL